MGLDDLHDGLKPLVSSPEENVNGSLPNKGVPSREEYLSGATPSCLLTKSVWLLDVGTWSGGICPILPMVSMLGEIRIIPSFISLIHSCTGVPVRTSRSCGPLKALFLNASTIFWAVE